MIDAGYKDVNQFMKAFEKSCRLLEEYQKASEDDKLFTRSFIWFEKSLYNQALGGNAS